MSSNTEVQIDGLIRNFHEVDLRKDEDQASFKQAIISVIQARESTLKAEYEAKLERQKELLNFEENYNNSIKGISDYRKFRASEPNSPERIASFINQLSPWNLEKGVQMLHDRDTEYEEKVRQAEKAYGGCHNCYGKGYATYDGEYNARGIRWPDHRMKFCDCERGKQLEALLNTPKNGEQDASDN